MWKSSSASTIVLVGRSLRLNYALTPWCSQCGNILSEPDTLPSLSLTSSLQWSLRWPSISLFWERRMLERISLQIHQSLLPCLLKLKKINKCLCTGFAFLLFYSSLSLPRLGFSFCSIAFMALWTADFLSLRLSYSPSPAFRISLTC